MVLLYWLYGLLALGLGGWFLLGISAVDNGAVATQASLGIAPHLLLVIVVASMAYDNFAIAISPHLGHGLLLKQLNRVRFWLHHLATPLLLVFVVAVRETSLSGLGSASASTHIGTHGGTHSGAVVLAWAIALALVCVGFACELRRPGLRPIACAGTLRYRSAGFSPWPSVLVTGAIAIFGFQLLRLTQSPWLLLAALGVFAVNGLRRDWLKLVLSPLAELLLLLALGLLASSH